MEARAAIELADFTSLFDGEGSEDIENKLLVPYKEKMAGTGIQEIDISLIDVFPNHPFKVSDDAKMEELADSIREYGVIHPVLVRKEESGRYMMISGHRRTYASRKAGLSHVPARVMNLSDEEAIILMTNANFLQRTEIKPSEKAKAYRMRYEAIKHQGKAGGSSLDEMGEAANESGKTVQRFIRLSYLSDDLLAYVDAGKLGITQGVEISFLTADAQETVFQVLKEHKIKLTKEQAAKVKDAARATNLTAERILQIVSGIENQVRTVELKSEIINQYFPDDMKAEEIENIIIGLLERWKED